MTNKVQIDLGSIADVASELDKITNNLHVDEETAALIRQYNKILDSKIHALCWIVSEHENKINALEYKQ
jgi:hypothetical protein